MVSSTVASRFVSRMAASLAGCALLLAVGGCSMFGPSVPKLKIGDVRLMAAADANRNSPIEIAIVVVADATLEQRFLNPEQKWFDSAPDLVATYPAAVRAYSCEFTPGQELRLPPSIFAGQRAHAVFVFARLHGGERRARIEQWREGGAISFTRDSWIVTADAKATAPPARPRDIGCRPSPGMRPA